MSTLQPRTYRRIAELMQQSIGLSLGDSKQPLVASRLAPRIQKLALFGYEDYLALLDADAAEFQVAVDLLTTNETYFFREPDHYALLEREFAQARGAAPQVWSAAASFGDEAYSIAMLLADAQTAGRIGADWSILATDISDRVLRSAKTAVYPEDRLRGVSADRRRRYCLRGEGDSEGLAMMSERITRHVRFGWLNLTQPFDDAGLGPFDVVLLRNVLIYFDADTKRDVVDRVLATLKPGGLFFIGTAEGRVPCRTPLQPLAPGVFRKPA